MLAVILTVILSVYNKLWLDFFSLESPLTISRKQKCIYVINIKYGRICDNSWGRIFFLHYLSNFLLFLLPYHYVTSLFSFCPTFLFQSLSPETFAHLIHSVNHQFLFPSQGLSFPIFQSSLLIFKITFNLTLPSAIPVLTQVWNLWQCWSSDTSQNGHSMVCFS